MAGRDRIVQGRHPGSRSADRRLRPDTQPTLVVDADLVALEDAGHLSMIERPEAFNRAVRDWLRGR